MTEPVREATKKLNDQRLLAAQLYIQNHLDGDLSLDSVARASGASPSNIHRLFKTRVGETIKKYSDRLRVEKSLYDIRITEFNLLQISLRYGFKNPETFTRVFKRHFEKPPSFFLKDRIPAPAKNSDKRAKPPFKMGLRSSKDTNFSITRLRELDLAFIRNIGPYEEVPLISGEGNTIWRELDQFAEIELRMSKPFIYLGIPQDSPGTTAPGRQRFDACLLVPKPFGPKGCIGCSRISGGYYGVLTHAGPYSTLAQAYTDLFRNASSLSEFSIHTGPLFELMLDISATTIDEHTWTELYLPLIPNGENL